MKTLGAKISSVTLPEFFTYVKQEIFDEFALVKSV